MPEEQSPIDMKTFAERYFGTDAAMRLSFVDDATGEPYTLEQADHLFATLKDKAPGMYSVFPDGLDGITCTHHAVQVGHALPRRTKILGFANEDNPDSLVAIEGIHPSGHDFAVIDDRWILDPWIRLVASAYDQICFDMHDPKDMEIVRHIYGDPSNWSRLNQMEEHYLNQPARTDVEIPPVEPVPDNRPSIIEIAANRPAFPQVVTPHSTGPSF